MTKIKSWPAKILKVHHAYLSSLFRKQTGKSITAYKNELLIEQAIAIFKKCNKNITEVSNKLGYSKFYYFRKVTGVVPVCILKPDIQELI